MEERVQTLEERVQTTMQQKQVSLQTKHSNTPQHATFTVHTNRNALSYKTNKKVLEQKLRDTEDELVEATG